jgi:DNA polymerase-3 subunit epsilon
MIERALRRRVPAFRLYNRCIDTAHLAIRCDHPGPSAEMISYASYSLDALAQRFQIRSSDRHTAWGDSLITAQLLLKLLRLRSKQVKPILRNLL